MNLILAVTIIGIAGGGLIALGYLGYCALHKKRIS